MLCRQVNIVKIGYSFKSSSNIKRNFSLHLPSVSHEIKENIGTMFSVFKKKWKWFDNFMEFKVFVNFIILLNLAKIKLSLPDGRTNEQIGLAGIGDFL